MSLKISLLTIETENTNPALLAALFELIERAGARGAVVVEQGSKRAARPKAEPAPVQPNCVSFPPCRGCRSGGACLAVPAPAPAPTPNPTPTASPEPAPEPVTEPVETAPAEEDEPEPAEEEPAEEEPASAAPEPATEAEAPRERPLTTPAKEPALADLPGGRVEGFVASAPATSTPQADLVERIVAAVEASPGATIPNLTVALLGTGSQGNRRRIDMLVGPLVMSGRLARADGRLFPNLKSARAWNGPGAPGRRSRSETTAPSSSPEAMYRKIIAAFAQNEAYSLPQLAVELFTDSSGRSVGKLQLMLRQLVASERLERTAKGYRAVGETERRARDEDEEDDDDAESNGQSDGDDLEELELE
jgi:hypothetical protein